MYKNFSFFVLLSFFSTPIWASRENEKSGNFESYSDIQGDEELARMMSPDRIMRDEVDAQHKKFVTAAFEFERECVAENITLHNQYQYKKMMERSVWMSGAILGGLRCATGASVFSKAIGLAFTVLTTSLATSTPYAASCFREEHQQYQAKVRTKIVDLRGLYLQTHSRPYYPIEYSTFADSFFRRLQQHLTAPDFVQKDEKEHAHVVIIDNRCWDCKHRYSVTRTEKKLIGMTALPQLGLLRYRGMVGDHSVNPFFFARDSLMYIFESQQGVDEQHIHVQKIATTLLDATKDNKYGFYSTEEEKASLLKYIENSTKELSKKADYYKLYQLQKTTDCDLVSIPLRTQALIEKLQELGNHMEARTHHK